MISTDNVKAPVTEKILQPNHLELKGQKGCGGGGTFCFSFAPFTRNTASRWWINSPSCPAGGAGCSDLPGSACRSETGQKNTLGITQNNWNGWRINIFEIQYCRMLGPIMTMTSWSSKTYYQTVMSQMNSRNTSINLHVQPPAEPSNHDDDNTSVGGTGASISLKAINNLSN